MPLYDYECEAGHRVEKLRPYDRRDEPQACPACGATMRRLAPKPHCVPDGMYSYAPNIGSEAQFARRLDAMKNGERVIKKEA